MPARDNTQGFATVVLQRWIFSSAIMNDATKIPAPFNGETAVTFNLSTPDIITFEGETFYPVKGIITVDGIASELEAHNTLKATFNANIIQDTSIFRNPIPKVEVETIQLFTKGFMQGTDPTDTSQYFASTLRHIGQISNAGLAGGTITMDIVPRTLTVDLGSPPYWSDEFHRRVHPTDRYFEFKRRTASGDQEHRFPS